MLAQRIWSNAVFLVKSYGKLRNYFLKVCWYVFCVSGAVFSKIIWKTTKLLFESLLVMCLCFCSCFGCFLCLSLLLFLVKSYGKLRNCFLKVCWLWFLCFCCCFGCCFFVSVPFLVKSYGKLRNCLLKVCWSCFLCF